MEIRIFPRELRLPTVVWIRDVFFGSRIRLFSIPDPNFFHLIKQFKYGILTKKWFLSSRKYDPGRLSRIRILIFYQSRIPESKKHRIRIRNTGYRSFPPCVLDPKQHRYGTAFQHCFPMCYFKTFFAATYQIWRRTYVSLNCTTVYCDDKLKTANILFFLFQESVFWSDCREQGVHLWNGVAGAGCF